MCFYNWTFWPDCEGRKPKPCYDTIFGKQCEFKKETGNAKEHCSAALCTWNIVNLPGKCPKHGGRSGTEIEAQGLLQGQVQDRKVRDPDALHVLGREGQREGWIGEEAEGAGTKVEFEFEDEESRIHHLTIRFEKNL
jgi:hypothetical protein